MATPLLESTSRRRTLAVALLVTELLVLTLVVVLFRQSSIESTLRRSVLSAISIDHPGLNVTVDGRDVKITGALLSGDDAKLVKAIAAKRRGVRTVDVSGLRPLTELDPENTGTVPGGIAAPTTAPLPVRPPQVSATFEGTTITVRGEVPTDEARSALLGRVMGSSTYTVEDETTIPPKAVEAADLAEYRRLGTFLDTMARLPVRSAQLQLDRTVLALTAEVTDDADRDLLRREAVTLVGGLDDRVRGAITVAGAVADTTVAADGSDGADTSTTTIEGTTTTEAGAGVLPSIPDTPEAKAAQAAIQTAIDGRTIGFDLNLATLSDEGKKVVADAAAALKGNTAKIEVGGHTDWKGKAPVNLELSQKRADAVRAALIDAGVDPSRITAKGYGEDVPIATNDTDAGRAKNRRIELRVVG